MVRAGGLDSLTRRRARPSPPQTAPRHIYLPGGKGRSLGARVPRHPRGAAAPGLTPRRRRPVDEPRYVKSIGTNVLCVIDVIVPFEGFGEYPYAGATV